MTDKKVSYPYLYFVEYFEVLHIIHEFESYNLFLFHVYNAVFLNWILFQKLNVSLYKY